MHQNSSSNHQNHRKKMEEDRVSQLSDPILQQILSLIDINEAVQTTILSTRWKNLWRSLSDLHFHISHLCSPDFVSHFLSHRDDAATVHNFHLSIDRSLVHDVDHTLIEKFMHYAVDHGVQSLRLHAGCSPELIPRDTVSFASKTLQELELRQFGYVAYLPQQFCFPHLKTLYLESYVFIYDCELHSISKEPFSGFPELEKLTLRRCMISGLVLKAPRLRFLEIIDDRESLNFYEAMILEEISAPLLTWFRYEGFFAFECSKVNLPMLEEVYLDIYKRMSEKVMVLKCVRMLQQLGNAKIVALTLDTLKVLEMDRGLIEQSPCPFPYMKCLILMRGRWEISTVLQSVMNYLTVGSLCFESLMVEFPDGMTVVEQNSEDLYDEYDSDYERQLERLFD